MRRIMLIMSLFALALHFVTAQHRASVDLLWPKPPEKPRFRFLYSFSSKEDMGIEKPWWRKILSFVFGEEKEVTHLIRPQGITVDADERILVTDPGARGFHIFDFKRKEYSFIREAKGISLLSPVGIAAAPDGTIYVSDPELHAVAVFDHEGRCKFSIKNGLRRPTGVWVDNNLLYVIDTEANQIVIFDTKGDEVYRIGRRGSADGEFNFPVYLCSGKTRDEKNDRKLYVVDAMNFRLQILRQNGEFIYKFGKLGNGVGDLARPKGVALDSDGHIYIVDALFDVVQIFDQKGTLLMALGGSGSGIGNFYLPAGIFIDTEDRVYVVDSGNRRIQVFQYLK
ncbi:MAG: 6-bladed beta-propeller [Bacteroidota bacterium]